MSNKQWMNTTTIIIDDYIREIENILNKQNLIIPQSIIMMIWTYYQITKIVFCIIDQYARKPSTTQNYPQQASEPLHVTSKSGHSQ